MKILTPTLLLLLASLQAYAQAADDVLLTEIPQRYQLFPRDAQNTAVVRIAGRSLNQRYDSVFTIITQNGEFMQRLSTPLLYSNNVSEFELLPKIYAGLSEYDLFVYVHSLSGDSLIAFRDSIVCGDVYIIDGQSNTVWTGDVGNLYSDEYCRTFGITASANPKDTLWARSVAVLSATAPNVGTWGLRLQQRILEEQGMPTCLINGGVGGTPIEAHQRNDTKPLTLNTIYGSLLYRMQKAEVAEAAKAIFWYQGESNSLPGYYGNFKAMYDDWKEDYPNFKKLYMFQHHMGCGGKSSPIRDLQRTIADSLPDVVQVSVMGIGGHDGCHYTTAGYTSIGDMVYKQVARDFYGSDDTVAIDPPNIIKAYYRGLSRDKLVLQFTSVGASLKLTSDTVVNGVPAVLKDYFYLGNDTSTVMSISTEGNKLVLHLKSPSIANVISYLPDLNYNRFAIIYEGPWLVNSRGVGALSFWRFPITDSVTLSAPNITDEEIHISAYPNPFSGRITLRYSVPNSSLVHIEICDVLGRHIQTVVDEVMTEGNYEKILEGNAKVYSSGVYYCRISIGNETKTIRLVVE